MQYASRRGDLPGNVYIRVRIQNQATVGRVLLLEDVHGVVVEDDRACGGKSSVTWCGTQLPLKEDLDETIRQ